MTLFEKILTILLLTSSVAYAQTTLTGVITDSKTNEPLVGANVILASSKKAALTNEHGKYTFLNLRPGIYTLQISYIGYESMVLEVKIENEKTKTFNTKLQSGEVLLSDVTVSGNHDRAINTLSQ